MIDLNLFCAHPADSRSYPDWNDHKRSYTEDDPTAPARRWKYMRNWVAKRLIGGAACQ